MASLQLYPLFIVLFYFLFSTSFLLTSSSDVALVLGKIKPSLQGVEENIMLSSWNYSVPLCQWRGLHWVFSNGSLLRCNDVSFPQRTNVSLFREPGLQLYSLQLPSAGLSGEIPREIGELSSLQSLYLGVNSLKGNVPLELGYSISLSDIDFSSNSLDGSLPPSIWNLCDRLVSLRLQGNNFSGLLPQPALPNSTCANLQVLDLSDNKFSGEFPEFVTQFHALKELDLANNILSGSLPSSIAGLDLERLNLSYNNFSGVLPGLGESKYGAQVFEGNNPALCGAPLGGCRGSSGMSSGGIAGLVIGLMTSAVVLASLLIGYVQGKKRNGGNEDDIEEGEEEESGDNGDGKLILFQGGEHLTLEDVLNATGQVMEKTTYGTVYKAKLADGGTIALRLLREGSCKERNSCLPVIKQLGRIRHENLVPLRAFYQGQRGEKLLIYDYLPNKSLYDHLHETRAGKPPMLNWARLHKIALGIARGLAYLHTGMEVPVIHGNVRSKNVLVDEFFVARLTEFGLDKMMVPAVADEIVAVAKSDGYKAPELQKMKKCNPWTDVYAYGILLLEILMGKKPGKDVSGQFVDLPSMVKVAVLEETTMEVFDVEILKGFRSPMEEGLVQALKLAMGCCAPVASVRPTMDEVVKQLEENRPRNRSALYSPTETRSEIGTPF
ncbi:putative kinase-like protein TMKL1 [Macadamia integrifolia]|uniref:putative kinase-like protein TMKL1 n=1 Tax=Macadamia integrifolia TaxID=60698 RepID=UPI001C52975A|nr:putative kinase-like protein TMKL1 [Macadamia integrifolia]